MRAFVRLREVPATHKELAHKLSELERRTDLHDEEIRSLFAAMHKLMEPPAEGRKERIGFHPKPLPKTTGPDSMKERGR